MATTRGPQVGCITLAVAAGLLLVGARTLASWVLQYQWWREMGQVETWVSMLSYAVSPAVLVAVLAFAAFWIAHARGMKGGGVRLRDYPAYGRLSTLALLLIAIIFSAAAVNSWTVVRFFGGYGVAADAWRDPTFGRPLPFYLFELPFYSMLLRAIAGLCIVTALIYYVSARAWNLVQTASRMRGEFEVDLPDIAAITARESRFLIFLASILLSAMAVSLYLDRYELLLADHGFMVGVDWVNERITIPLLWASVGACLIAALLLWLGRWRWALALIALSIVARFAVPRAVAGVYVRPNELAIQREYIHRHIEGTRQAFGLNTRITERDFDARLEAPIDVVKNRATLDNVRLWDWRAFHDTVSQIQPLRPYVYSDTDVDRYTIDGQLRQVMLSPRELELNQLGEDARSRWTNPHLVYTHGYGMVVAEANRITANGLPVLFVDSAPPVIHTSSLKLTRPELYYGDVVHEPVFVRTDQQEFNYPSGSENVHMTYDGRGGFPIYSLPLRLAAAIVYGDWNIVLTGQLNAESRMMIHRRVQDRLAKLAGFVHWDSDPYLVLSKEGRSVWIVDGYLTTDAHPYSRAINVQNVGSVNYIRNSVKATVDAYDGTVRLYVFDTADPLVNAYRRLFPGLFTDASAMPEDLRAHARYPETIFRVQAEVYRAFHMRDAESFYNRADQWDIARSLQGQDAAPAPAPPTYVIATLPGEQSAEFLLLIPFTPRNKDNLIGFMAARCDGPHLGELVVLQLSKQEVLLGPMQVEARINQDQNISKDLSLWNQQGSQVLRGQILVLPIDNTFLYVEPIYIQAKEARMPQLKKVVVAVGNTLIYTDTYQQALEQLARVSGAPPTQTQTQTPGAPIEAGAAAPGQPLPAAAVPAPAGRDARIDTIRDHLRRYREFSSQGRWAEAGKELEAVEAAVKR